MEGPHLDFSSENELSPQSLILLALISAWKGRGMKFKP